ERAGGDGLAAQADGRHRPDRGLDHGRGVLHPAAADRQHHGPGGARAHLRAGGAAHHRLHRAVGAGHGPGRIGAAGAAGRRARPRPGHADRAGGQGRQRRHAEPAGDRLAQLDAGPGADGRHRPAGGRPARAAGDAPEHRRRAGRPLGGTTMKLLKSLLSGAAMLLVLAVFLAAWIALPWPALLGLAALFALWMLLTRSGRQAASVTLVGVSTLAQRMGASSVVVIGIAGVVGVLVALLAMAEGYRQTVS